MYTYSGPSRPMIDGFQSPFNHRSSVFEGSTNKIKIENAFCFKNKHFPLFSHRIRVTSKR